MLMGRLTLFDFGSNLAMSPGHWLNAGVLGSSVPCMEEGERIMRSRMMRESSHGSVVAKTVETRKSCAMNLAGAGVDRYAVVAVVVAVVGVVACLRSLSRSSETFLRCS